MKKLIFAVLVLLTMTSVAQLAQTKSTIIRELGYDYTSDVADDGTPFIMYETKMQSDASGYYSQFKAIYFFTASTGETLCYMWKIFEPASETNYNVAWYNKRYVKIGTTRWKDYATDIVYDIEVKDGICVITAWLESND